MADQSLPDLMVFPADTPSDLILHRAVDDTKSFLAEEAAEVLRADSDNEEDLLNRAAHEPAPSDESTMVWDHHEALLQHLSSECDSDSDSEEDTLSCAAAPQTLPARAAAPPTSSTDTVMALGGAKGGTALTLEERAAIRKGVCPQCGITTHDIAVFKRTPLTNDHVVKGICIHCNPRVPAALRENSCSTRPRRNTARAADEEKDAPRRVLLDTSESIPTSRRTSISATQVLKAKPKAPKAEEFHLSCVHSDSVSHLSCESSDSDLDDSSVDTQEDQESQQAVPAPSSPIQVPPIAEKQVQAEKEHLKTMEGEKDKDHPTHPTPPLKTTPFPIQVPPIEKEQEKCHPSAPPLKTMEGEKEKDHPTHPSPPLKTAPSEKGAIRYTGIGGQGERLHPTSAPLRAPTLIRIVNSNAIAVPTATASEEFVVPDGSIQADLVEATPMADIVVATPERLSQSESCHFGRTRRRSRLRSLLCYRKKKTYNTTSQAAAAAAQAAATAAEAATRAAEAATRAAEAASRAAEAATIAAAVAASHEDEAVPEETRPIQRTEFQGPAMTRSSRRTFRRRLQAL